MTEHNNPPAFPTAKVTINGVDVQDGIATYSPGLTMLDHFAGLAMQSQIGNPLKAGDDEAHRLIAERSYRMANSMMKERVKWIK